jgi:hypothetical protein
MSSSGIAGSGFRSELAGSCASFWSNVKTMMTVVRGNTIESCHSSGCARFCSWSASAPLSKRELRAHPMPVLGKPILQSAAKIHGGTPTPSRTSDAKEASVLFRPELSALY